MQTTTRTFPADRTSTSPTVDEFFDSLSEQEKQTFFRVGMLHNDIQIHEKLRPQIRKLSKISPSDFERLQEQFKAFNLDQAAIEGLLKSSLSIALDENGNPSQLLEKALTKAPDSPLKRFFEDGKAFKLESREEGSLLIFLLLILDLYNKRWNIVNKVSMATTQTIRILNSERADQMMKKASAEWWQGLLGGGGWMAPLPFSAFMNPMTIQNIGQAMSSAASIMPGFWTGDQHISAFGPRWEMSKLDTQIQANESLKLMFQHFRENTGNAKQDIERLFDKTLSLIDELIRKQGEILKTIGSNSR